MSHHAHGTNRVYGHASRTREMEKRTPTQFSLYRELHPEMYGKVAKREPALADRIADYIRSHVGTVSEIATALNCSPSAVARLLSRDRIPGAAVVGKKVVGRQTVKVWGTKGGM